MTLAAYVPACESLFDILRKAARLSLELLAASLLVFAGIRRRGVALPGRKPLSGASSAPTMPNPFRPVRATLCPGLFPTAHAGPRSYTSPARAMGLSGGVRSGNGARRPNRRSGAPSVPTTPDRSAYLSRDTFRVRVMGLSGGVRSGNGARRPIRQSGAPSVPTTPDRSTHVSRDTFRARAMGVSGDVRSGDGAGGRRLARRHPCGQPDVSEPATGSRYRPANTGPQPRMSRAIRFAYARWGCPVVVRYGWRWRPATRAGRLCATRPHKPRKRALLP